MSITKITMAIHGVEIEMSLDEARKLYEELHSLFGCKQAYTWEWTHWPITYYPWTYITPTYPAPDTYISCCDEVSGSNFTAPTDSDGGVCKCKPE